MARQKRRPKTSLPDWMQTFRKNLRDTRRRLKISQIELGKRAETFGSAISAIERGQRPGIHFDTAKRLADAMGVTVDDLMGVGKTTPRPGDATKIPQETVVERPGDLD